MAGQDDRQRIAAIGRADCAHRRGTPDACGQLRIAQRAAVRDRGQREVWTALATIPYGQTLSYAQLAARVGRAGASRAVGAANGRNPLPIVLPCHRVIGADGSLTGFGGGLPAKQFLLKLEGALPEAFDLFADPGAAGDGRR